MRTLEIWMAASEMSPVAQTGGLADVVRALPQALARRGHRVRVFIPAYGRIERGGLEYDPGEDHVAVPGGIGRVPVRFPGLPGSNGVRLTLVQSEEMFGRDGLYGPAGGDYPDNARRFSLFARAVAELAARAPRPPDVLHGHDWHAGLLPLFASRVLRWPGRRPALVHTIHNMGYQGRFAAQDLDWITPYGALRDALGGIDGMEYEGGISFLKAALVWSDRLTAVSPRYAWEITTMEGGFGLHDVAWRRRGDLAGILNGADYEHWDPATDRHIPERYGAGTLERKEAARAALRAAFGLAAQTPARAAAPARTRGARSRRAAGAAGERRSRGARGASAAARTRGVAADASGASPAQRPLVGVVSRLVEQKGIDLVLGAAPALLRSGADLVVLGAGDQGIVDGLERLRAAHPHRVGIYIGFNDPLAHLLVAGSDLLLVPSRYEPCGLVQMHAMRYGTIPVVRRTGGLADTVRDETASPGRGTGFVFDEVAAGDLARAAHRAMILRAADPGAWAALQRRAMAEDFSWDRAAGAYERLYAAIAA